MATSSGKPVEQADKLENNSVLTLPLDLQIHVLSFLDPLDILRLRMTCTTLHDTTSQRIVWMEAVRRMCIENTVFLGTFPLEQMSMPELERAATAPFNWLRETSVETENGLYPVNEKFFEAFLPEECNDDFEHFELDELFLVPGGRYLITFASNQITVWDLGCFINPRYAKVSEPLASIQVESHSVCMQLVHPSPDGQALRIFISYKSKDNCKIFKVYEIYPQIKVPELTEIGHLEPDPALGSVSFHSLSKDRLVFMQGSILNIWDYKTGGWINWIVEGVVQQLISGPTFIILIHSEGVYLWRIPTLLSSSPLFRNVEPQIIAPLFSMTYPSPGLASGPNVKYAGLGDWYSGTSAQCIYDIYDCSGDERPVMRRYEVVVNSDSSEANLVEHKPCPGETPINPFTLAEYRLCDAFMVAWERISAMEVMAFYTSPLQSKINKHSPPLVDRVSDKTHLSLVPTSGMISSFCPISGRHVYIHEDFMDIGVQEFLLYHIPPPRKSKKEQIKISTEWTQKWMNDLTGWTPTTSSPVTPF